MSRTLGIGCALLCAGVVAGCGGSHHHEQATPGMPAAGLSAAGAKSTLVEWRSHVGRGTLSPRRKLALGQVIHTAAHATRATILREAVLPGKRGAAVYLDLASSRPIWTLRHLDPLIVVASGTRFPGGWAIRLDDARHRILWLAGHAGNEGFVGSATAAVDAVSPVLHG